MQNQCDVCTFRNNLNKIFATPLDLKNSWVVDACMLGNILYLDIHKLPEKSFPNADLFQYYGYRSVAVAHALHGISATAYACQLVPHAAATISWHPAEVISMA